MQSELIPKNLITALSVPEDDYLSLKKFCRIKSAGCSNPQAATAPFQTADYVFKFGLFSVVVILNSIHVSS